MRKPAPLAAGVLLKKGQAAPMSDSQGRDGHSPVFQSMAPLGVVVPQTVGAVSVAVPPSIALLPMAGALPATAEQPTRTRTADLEPLGFKVPPQFNQEFRRFAFENGYKLNELLFAAFEAFKKARIRESVNS